MARYKLLKKILLIGVCLCLSVPMTANAAAITPPDSNLNSVDNKFNETLPLHHGNIGSIVTPPKSPEYYLSSTTVPNARCKTSPMTQEKFIGLIQAIIKHGDLTDKAFIEKTLRIKFGSAKKSRAYSHIPDGGIYDANMPSDMSDAPIGVSLNAGEIVINEATRKPDLYSEIAFFHMDRVGAVFHDCRYLTRKQLDPKSEATAQHLMGKKFSSKVGNANKQPEQAIWYLKKASKNGTDIKITYSFRADDGDAIEDISISQEAPTQLKPIGEENAKR